MGAVVDGLVDIVASDHSPSDPSLKKEGDFRTSWGGMAGVQSTLAVLFERGLDGRRLRFEQIAAPRGGESRATRSESRQKARLTTGNDADLLLLDPSRSYTLEAAHLLQRHKISPYVGFEFSGVVVRTIRRGETIFQDGKIVAETRGAFVRAASVAQGFSPASKPMSDLLIVAGPLQTEGPSRNREGAADVRGLSRDAAVQGKPPARAVERRIDVGAARQPGGGVPPENATTYPLPGEILLYPGGVSETEILIPYGRTQFGSKAGLLAGNHFLTVVSGAEHLTDLGRLTLWKGAQPILIDRFDD